MGVKTMRKTLPLDALEPGSIQTVADTWLAPTVIFRTTSPNPFGSNLLPGSSLTFKFEFRVFCFLFCCSATLLHFTFIRFAAHSSTETRKSHHEPNTIAIWHFASKLPLDGDAFGAYAQFLPPSCTVQFVLIVQPILDIRLDRDYTCHSSVCRKSCIYF